MAGSHRADRAQSPWLLIGAFVVIAGLLIVLFRFAAPGADATHVVDDAAAPASDDNVVAAAAAVATDPVTVQPLGNFQRGIRIRKKPPPKPVCSRVAVAESITVLTYNIKSGHVSSLGKLAGVMRGAGADVVLLQEVDRNRRGTGRVNQAASLAGQMGGWHHAFGQNVSHGGDAGYGTAIISRWPIVSSTNTHLPNGPGGQQRGLLKAVVSIGGMHVSFYSTHLQNKIDGLKVKQARAIAGIVAGDGNPRILGGDMNSWPKDTPQSILRSQFTDTWDVVGRGGSATNPASNPRGRIDVLLYNGSEIRPTSADVLGSRASDHRAVRGHYSISGVTEEQCSTPGR